MNLGFKGYLQTVLWMAAALIIAVCIYPWQNGLMHEGDRQNATSRSREETLVSVKQDVLSEKVDELGVKKPTKERALAVRQAKLQGKGICRDCGKVHGAADSVLIKHLNRSTEGLVEIEIEGGGTAIDLNGRFHHGSSASINDAGEVEILCSTSIAEVLHGNEGVGGSTSLEIQTALK